MNPSGIDFPVMGFERRILYSIHNVWTELQITSYITMSLTDEVLFFINWKQSFNILLFSVKVPEQKKEVNRVCMHIIPPDFPYLWGRLKAYLEAWFHRRWEPDSLS